MNKWIIGNDAWRELFIAQEASGLGVKEFCKNERVCKTSFYDKRREFGRTTGQDLQEEHKIPKASNNANGFIRLKSPVRVEPTLPISTIRIETPNGYAVTGYAGNDLRSCLEVLKCL